jgi:uncharacterized membrane protein YbhN (UPF0104 family)
VTPSPKTSARWKRLLPLAASLAIIVVAGAVLYRELATIDVVDVARRFAAIPVTSFLLAGVLTAGAFLSLAIYEVAMLRYIDAPVSSRRPFFTALMAYPIGHAVGFGALSGGAVRFRIYSAAGLSTFDIGKIVVLSVMPYAAGLGLLAGLGALIDSAEVARYLRVSEPAAVGIGAGVLLAHVAYVAAVLWWRRPVAIRRVQVELPAPRLTGIQYALGIVDAMCGILVLYVLLPDSATIGFLPFATVYVLSIMVGLASSVPAGLGVFESMLLVLLKGVPPDELLGSILAYRLVFELVPFTCGVLLFIGYEGWSRRDLLTRRRAGS